MPALHLALDHQVTRAITPVRDVLALEPVGELNRGECFQPVLLALGWSVSLALRMSTRRSDAVLNTLVCGLRFEEERERFKTRQEGTVSDLVPTIGLLRQKAGHAGLVTL